MSNPKRVKKMTVCLLQVYKMLKMDIKAMLNTAIETSTVGLKEKCESIQLRINGFLYKHMQTDIYSTSHLGSFT